MIRNPVNFGESELTRERTLELFAGLAATAIVAALMVYFHDRTWWPPDDGYFAHVADTILRGGVLHRDVHSIHPGYIDFTNAGAMWAFGADLLSMRYPLALLAVVNCMLAFGLLLPRGVHIAFAGGISSGAFSFIQFINPSPNWYIPTFALLIIAAASWMKPESRIRVPLIGFLLVTAFMYRQLSGVHLIMATVTWLLLEQRGNSDASPRLARLILTVFAAVTAAYVVSKWSATSLLLFGVWPVLALVIAWRRVAMADGAALRLVGGLALGGIIGAVPLLAYHFVNGSVADWMADAFLDAVRFGFHPQFVQRTYSDNLIYPALFLIMEWSWIGAINAVFWYTALLLPAALGWQFLRLYSAPPPEKPWPIAVLLPVFYGLGAIHDEIAIYLLFTTAMTVFGALYLVESKQQKQFAAASILALSLVAVTLHAGRPVTRGIHGAMSGVSAPLDLPGGFPRASVAMEKKDAELYGILLRVIAENTTPEDKILALPFNPEFYFLSQRRAAMRSFVSQLGLRSEAETRAAIAALKLNPPKVLINRPEDKYNDDNTKKLFAALADRYRLERSTQGFDIYLLK